MSEPATENVYLDSELGETELTSFLGYVGLPPEQEAALWREHDRAVTEYETFFEDDNSA